MNCIFAVATAGQLAAANYGLPEVPEVPAEVPAEVPEVSEVP